MWVRVHSWHTRKSKPNLQCSSPSILCEIKAVNVSPLHTPRRLAHLGTSTDSSFSYLPSPCGCTRVTHPHAKADSTVSLTLQAYSSPTESCQLPTGSFLYFAKTIRKCRVCKFLCTCAYAQAYTYVWVTRINILTQDVSLKTFGACDPWVRSEDLVPNIEARHNIPPGQGTILWSLWECTHV